MRRARALYSAVLRRNAPCWSDCDLLRRARRRPSAVLRRIAPYCAVLRLLRLIATCCAERAGVYGGGVQVPAREADGAREVRAASRDQCVSPRNQRLSREGHALAAADAAREVRAPAKATRRPWQPPRRLAAQLGAASLLKLTELADASSGLPGTGFGLPGTGFGLPGTGFGLPWTVFGLPGTGFRLGVDRTGS